MTLFTDKVQQYHSRLIHDLNITSVQACGVWGNIGGETGGFSALQEKNPLVKGSRGGYGWLQWTGPRRKKYEVWARNKGLDTSLDETNYQYLVYETSTDESHSLVQLRQTTTVEAATETFMKQNLRPGVPNLSGRIDWAKKAFTAVQTQSVSNAKTGTVGAVVAVGGASALVAHTNGLVDFFNHWYWFVGAGSLTLLIGFWLIHLHHNAVAAKALKSTVVVKPVKAVRKVKRSKKNG